MEQKESQELLFIFEKEIILNVHKSGPEKGRFVSKDEMKKVISVE